MRFFKSEPLQGSQARGSDLRARLEAKAQVVLQDCSVRLRAGSAGCGRMHGKKAPELLRKFCLHASGNCGACGFYAFAEEQSWLAMLRGAFAAAMVLSCVRLNPFLQPPGPA